MHSRQPRFGLGGHWHLTWLVSPRTSPTQAHSPSHSLREPRFSTSSLSCSGGLVLLFLHMLPSTGLPWGGPTVVVPQDVNQGGQQHDHLWVLQSEVSFDQPTIDGIYHRSYICLCQVHQFIQVEIVHTVLSKFDLISISSFDSSEQLIDQSGSRKEITNVTLVNFTLTYIVKICLKTVQIKRYLS